MTTNTKKIDPKEIQRLREDTSAGVMDCKRALEDADGDYEKAKQLLTERSEEVGPRGEGGHRRLVHPRRRAHRLARGDRERDRLRRAR
jgi:hypothetical protein